MVIRAGNACCIEKYKYIIIYMCIVTNRLFVMFYSTYVTFYSLSYCFLCSFLPKTRQERLIETKQQQQQKNVLELSSCLYE
jgi:hypothetical protein